MYIFVGFGSLLLYTPRGQDKDSRPHLTMSDADGPDGQADQSVDLLPNEWSQPSRRSLWYLRHATRAALCSSYMNVLLVFVPIGVAAGALGWAAVKIFFLNFLAIISLAPVMTFSTGELSARVGRVLGGLLKAVLGNAVETIVRHLCLSVVLYFALLCLTRLVFVERLASLP